MKSVMQGILRAAPSRILSYSPNFLQKNKRGGETLWPSHACDAGDEILPSWVLTFSLLEFQRGNSQQFHMLSIWGFKGRGLCVICVGDEVYSTIKEGIKNSMSAIIVFSQNYAYSTWCLDELVLILKATRTPCILLYHFFWGWNSPYQIPARKLYTCTRKA